MGRPPSTDSRASGRSDSTHSTIKDHTQVRERFCTITVNDGYMKDEVLINMDRLGPEYEPGALMAITAVKGDPPASGSSYAGTNKSATSHPSAKPDGSSGLLLDKDFIGSRYVFLTRDMPKEIKNRHPDVDISIPKHIAEAFGMRKSSHVVLSPVIHPTRLYHLNRKILSGSD